MPAERRSISVQQCLFGYDDGHHLLASSTPLSDDSLARLLPLSDLAPGLSLGREDSYWSGLPLPSAKAYVLMRTWSAWEMRRPGCVWSHALLIDFSDLPELSDLGILHQYSVTRPTLGELARFRAALEVETTPAPVVSIGNADDALDLLREVYSHRTGVFRSPHDVVPAVFAVWSQQWPRLRRSFSFRTASSSVETMSPTHTLDLLVMCGNRDQQVAPPSLSERTALDDLVANSPSQCRRFLWRYGADLRNGREHFWFLVDAYNASRSLLVGSALDTLLERTELEIPTQSEARLLKEDLLSCGLSPYSLISSVDFTQLYTTLLTKPHNAFRAPTAETLRSLIRTHLSDAIALGELATSQDSELARSFLDAIAAEFTAEIFLSATHERPGLRMWVLRKRPEMISDEVLKRMEPSDVMRLLASLQAEGELARPVVQHVCNSENSELVRACVRECRDFARDHWVQGMNQPHEVPLTQAWSSALSENAETLLEDGFLAEMQTVDAFARAARHFGHNAPSVMRLGPDIWVRNLERFPALDVIPPGERDGLCAFLFLVAAAKPSGGSEVLFERTFDILHTAILYSRLDGSAFTLLQQNLPHVEWWRTWDSCRRLRIAVVNAYVDGGLRIESFRRLTRDRHVYGQLIDIAEETKRGRRFVGGDS